MAIDDVVTRLAERYGALLAPPARKRKRRSVLDAYLPEMRKFTLRRLHSSDPDQFSLRKLAGEIAGKSGRRICKDSVRKSLIKHNLYQLWKEHNEN